jgi:hypothetical protein
MTGGIENLIGLPAAIGERLSAEDDPALWMQVLKAVAEDASQLDLVSSNLYAEAGVCSHWFRPNRWRWTAAGGFAYPIGYSDGEGPMAGPGLPGFDWSMRLAFIPASLTRKGLVEDQLKRRIMPSGLAARFC